MTLQPGTQLGHYEITSLLGSGGMGEVYRAKDHKLGRDVAIKVLREELASDPERLRRFEQEARSASALNHPNIITIYDIGKHETTPYIAMEFVEGKTLREMLSEGPLPTKKLLQLATQIAEGLAKAHSAGIIHRDLKPANLMVTSDGYVKILDFGLAKLLPEAVDFDSEMTTMTKELTRDGFIVGTVGYMSPEQASGRPLDHRSDQFSFGAILYEMATAIIAFQRDTAAQALAAIIEGEPEPIAQVNPQVPAHLQVIVERCMEKEPEERYESTRDLARELEGLREAPFELPLILTRRAALVGIVALVALGLVVLLGLNVGGLRDRLLGGASPIESIAVLPLQNLSGDPEQEYFVDGMTEALITDLAKSGALKVISRSSAMRYKGTDKPLSEIARELKVDAVVEGSAQRVGDNVRIMAQLIDPKTEQALWADSYEQDLENVLRLQREVAQAVARMIRIKLRPEEDTQLAAARTVNPATYEAYLKGMFHLNKGTPEEIKKGLAYLHEAVEKDPADALANAGLALGYVELAHGGEAREDSLLRARAAATTALKLDGTLAEALAARAMLKGYYEWNWDEAFRDFDRALDVNPSLSIAYFHRAWFHVLFGRMAQAEEDQKKAGELDPFNPALTSHLGMLYSYERRHEEALAEALKSIEMAPEFPLGYGFLARIYRDNGRYDEAIAAAQKAGELSPAWRGVVGLIYAGTGRMEEARNVLAELDQQKPTPINALWKIQICIAIGEMDEAFRWLDYEPRHGWVPWVTVMPGLEPLRSDPRFKDLLLRMNLPPIEQ